MIKNSYQTHVNILTNPTQALPILVALQSKSGVNTLLIDKSLCLVDYQFHI